MEGGGWGALVRLWHVAAPSTRGRAKFAHCSLFTAQVLTLPSTTVKIVKMRNTMAVRVGFLWPINGKVCNACTCNRFVARHVAALAATLSACQMPCCPPAPTAFLHVPHWPSSSLIQFFFSFRSCFNLAKLNLMSSLYGCNSSLF